MDEMKKELLAEAKQLYEEMRETYSRIIRCYPENEVKTEFELSDMKNRLELQKTYVEVIKDMALAIALLNLDG